MREAETNVAATCGRRGGGRESGRERGGDKPYESRKREAMRGMEWSGKGVEMLGSDSDMGVAEGSMPRFDSIRRCINATLSLHLSLSLSL